MSPLLVKSENSRSSPRPIFISYLIQLITGSALLFSITPASAAVTPAELAASAEKEKTARAEKAKAFSFTIKSQKEQAAELYVHAMKLAPQIFNFDEKLAIAKLLVAVKRRRDAITILQAMANEPHQGFVAELTLANLVVSQDGGEKGRTAEWYIQALKLAPQAFNYDEKIAIAKFLVNSKRRQEAIALLQNMVNEPHNGLTAELTLAKLLTSTGEYGAALDEADEILQRDQKNTGALLVKGTALHRRKAFGDAIKAYRSILARADDFDARLGLVYCLLAIGQKQEAEKQFKLLRAQDEWQQSDLLELSRNIDVNVHPVVEYMHTKFSDTDNYHGYEQDFNAKTNISDWDISLAARHRTATGDGLSAIADTGILYVGRNVSERLRMLGGVGVTNLSWQQDSSDVQHFVPFSIGEFRMDAQIWMGTAQFSYSSQALTANANLIHNAVGVNRSEIVYNKSLNKAVTVKAMYRNSKYSDDNVAHELEGLALLALNSGAPQFSLGYAYRNLNFQHTSTQGYFDPQDYVSNRIMVLAAYESGPFYLYAEYVAGRQVYERNQQNHDEEFNHVGVTTGATLWKGLRMELSAEKNNSNAALSDYAYGDSSISWRVSYSL